MTKEMNFDQLCKDHYRHLRGVVDGPASKTLILGVHPPHYSEKHTVVNINDFYALKSLPSTVFDAVLLDKCCVNALWKSEPSVLAVWTQLFRVLKQGGKACGIYVSGRPLLGTKEYATLIKQWADKPPVFGGVWDADGGKSKHLVFDSVFRKVSERVGFNVALLDTGAKTLPTEGHNCLTAFGLLKPYE